MFPRLFSEVSIVGVILSLMALPLGSRSRPAAIEDLMKIRNVQGARISPSGDLVAYVVSDINLEKNISDTDIWLVKTTGGPPFRLTCGPGRDDAPQWSPDGQRITFLSDRDGSIQVWTIEPRGGEASKLTAIRTGVSSVAWAPDGRSLAFLALPSGVGEDSGKQKKEGDEIVFDQDAEGSQIFVLDISSKKVRPLTRGQFCVVDFSWSPDGKRIAFAAQPTPKIPDMYKTDLFIVDVESEKVQDLVKRVGVDTSPRWSPDGSKIAFLSTDGSTGWIANWYVCLVTAEGGSPRNVTQKHDEFVFSPQWSWDGRKIFFQSPEGVRNQLFSVSPEGGEIQPLWSGDSVWSDFNFSSDGKTIAFLGTDALTPDEVFVNEINDFKPLRLTFTNPQLDSISLSKTEVIHWKSFDGLEIEGLLLKPPEFKKGKPCPLLTYVHGGPSGRFTQSFSPQIGAPYPIQAECYPLQVLAGLGYAVFMPNPRGSYGYGEKFRIANVKDWGGGDYRDVMSGIDQLVEQKIADPERLGILGRSYGGYLTGWIISQTDRFKAASLGAGMSDLMSFYGQTDIPGYVEYYLGDVPWNALHLYEQRSPVVHAQNIKTPVLILHGENDSRVPIAQARELYTALKKMNVPVQFVIYPRQGHVAVEPRSMLDMMKRNLAWITQWIK